MPQMIIYPRDGGLPCCETTDWTWEWLTTGIYAKSPDEEVTSLTPGEHYVLRIYLDEGPEMYKSFQFVLMEIKYVVDAYVLWFAKTDFKLFEWKKEGF